MPVKGHFPGLVRFKPGVLPGGVIPILHPQRRKRVFPPLQIRAIYAQQVSGQNIEGPCIPDDVVHI